MQLGKSILVITIALIGVLIAILAENVHLPTFLTLFYKELAYNDACTESVATVSIFTKYSRRNLCMKI